MEQIASTPALLAEAEAVLPALKHVATAKAGADGVRKVIAKRFETFPQPQRTDEQWAAWWSDYFDALSDVSLASLEAGMRAYVADKGSEFMPKPGKLRELAFTAPCRSLTRYYRAKRAVELALAPPPVERVEPQAVREILADFKAKALPPKPARPPAHNNAGKVDAGGLTPEMRELIARRHGGAS